MPTRRVFLQSSAAAGAALCLSFDLPELRAAGAEDAAAFEPNAYLQIGSDDVVTLWVTRQEMGQGVRTVLPMMLAEELDADWSRVRLEQAMPGGKFKDIRLHTSGSSSSSAAYITLRTAGAAAREMLVAAAAARWGVDAAACVTAKGAVTHPPTGRSLPYGALAAAAARLPVPARPALKDPRRFALLGRPTRRVDAPAIVTGAATYGLDVRLPGMLYASVERAPTLGARLVHFDATAALARPAVRHVMAVKAGIHPGVAVVAGDSWSALQARAALKIDWEPGPHATFDSDVYLAGLENACARATFKVRHEGDAEAAIARAATRHEATYVFPFQAHAPMETMSCTAEVRNDSVEVWAPTQTEVRTLAQVTRVTGLPAEKITLHCLLMGGAFGRRLFSDFVAETVEIAKAVGKPVQLLWSRADDLRHGYFQPATAERFRAGLDAQGRVSGLVHQTTASDLTIYAIHDGRDIWTTPAEAKKPDHYESDQSPWGAYDTPYEIADLRVDCADVTSPVPVGPWRAVEYPSTVFGRESFLDELAHHARRDPLAFRLDLLKGGVRTVGPYAIDQGRLARTLDEVRRRSGWDTALPGRDGRLWGRGVAANVYHGRSYLAMVAEVSLARDLSDLRVHRVVVTIDCGLALNPLGLEGQTESGVAWGLSAALLGKVDFKQGRAVASGFDGFEVLRLDRMPRVETHILASDAAPAGFGEHPVPTVAPAVANAVFRACGRRVRRLPITPASLAKS